MDPIPLVEFDVRGTNPKNTIVGEEWNLKDKTLNWYLPNGAPFFGEPGLVVMYNQDGGLLKRDRDYFVEGEFSPFCTITGRSICTFVRLSDQIVKDNKKVSIDYQSLGVYFVPRNNLEDWLKQIQGGKVPIPWSKVFKVPPTLPAEYHLHNAKLELGDWYDFTQFFLTLTNIRKTRVDGFNARLDEVVADAYAKLNKARDSQLTRLRLHDANYHNPHDTDAFDINMGNHPNFKTATLAEDLAGVRNDVLSTPFGVIELAKQYVPDTDKAMRSGIFPVSSFGGETFIPPTISGSFEGMGQINECAGICLEPSGILTLLSNHRDGRTEGLYFSTVKDYNKDSIKIVYTNYKYEPPVLKAIGVTVDRIVSGSGNKVILVGVDGTNNWYISLTNGTFDPASHALVKCDMSAVVADVGSPWSVYDNAVIHFMGDYLVLAQTYRDNEGLAHTRFYRVKTSDVRNNLAVTWERITVSYQTLEGVQVNSPDFKPIGTTRDASNNILRMGPYTSVRPFQALNLMRRMLNLSAAKEGSGGIYYWHMFAYYHMALAVAPNFFTTAGSVEMIYEFNPATGAMALTYKTPNRSFDHLQTSYLSSDLQHMDNSAVSFTAPSSVVLSTGEVVSSLLFEGQAAFPASLKVIKLAGRNTPQQLMANSWSTNSQAAERVIITTPVVEPPTLNGTSPSGLSYEADGELFSATDQKSLARQMYFRLISGGYQVRDGVNNLKLPSINSRPLTTAIYKTNLDIRDGSIALTGSAADLAAGGVECGSNSLSVFAFSSTYPNDWVPNLPAFRAAGVAYSFPRTYSRALDNINKKATYKVESFYGMRQNILDKLKAYLTNGATNWSVTSNHLGSEMGGMFAGLNLSLVTVSWTIPGTNKLRTQLLLLRPVLEAPNATHPNVYLITDYTVLDAPANHRQWSGVAQSAQPGFYPAPPFPVRAYCALYKNGNNLKVSMQAGFLFASAEQGYSAMNTIVDIDLTTNKFSGLFAGSSIGGIADVAVMIPKVGMSDVTLTGNAPETLNIVQPAVLKYDNTGTAAAIYKAGGNNYLTMSVYPDTGWLIFIQDGIQLMLNGAIYSVPGGTIDLRDVDPGPQNKTFYLYVTIEDDQPKYVVSGVQLRKSNSMIRVSTIVTNDRQILTISREQPFMVADLLLSYNREGGTIPMSAGFPQDEGQFVFLHNGELLP